MRRTSPNQEVQYTTDNIIFGMGEVPAMRTDAGLCWVLPGNGITYTKEVAIEYAKKLDKVIRANLSKYKRVLFR